MPAAIGAGSMAAGPVDAEGIGDGTEAERGA
jgi:hypothetical protein